MAFRGEILRILAITHGSMVQAEKLTASLRLRLLPDRIEVFFQGLLSLLRVRDFARMILSLRCHRRGGLHEHGRVCNAQGGIFIS